MSKYAFKIRGWAEFQHYKERNPSWIKLHYSLLSSEDWVTYDDASRALAVACMLIASHNYNKGRVPADSEYIQRVAYLNSKPNFKPLIDSGFLEPLADASILRTNALPETETYRDIDTESSLRSDSAEPQNAEQTFEPIPFEMQRPLDYQLALFDLGLPWLAEKSGRQAAGLRPLLGKWLKLTGGDAQAIFELMQTAERQGIGEPVSWIAAALKPGSLTPLEAAQARAVYLEAAEHG